MLVALCHKNIRLITKDQKKKNLAVSMQLRHHEAHATMTVGQELNDYYSQAENASTQKIPESCSLPYGIYYKGFFHALNLTIKMCLGGWSKFSYLRNQISKNTFSA